MVSSDQEKGDTYDEDTGNFLGSLDLPEGVPAQIAVFIDGYWYIFKPSHRYKHEPRDPAPEDEQVRTVTKQETLTARELLEAAGELQKDGHPPTIPPEQSILP
jgi:hypothetical protein